MSKMEFADAQRRARIFHGYTGQWKAHRQKQALPQSTLNRLQRFTQLASLKEAALVVLLVVASVTLVHVPRARADETGDGAKLPPHVADLRDAILTAAHSGNIEELKSAFDVSGSVPDLGISPRSDPIRVLKDRSEDPSGRDTLAALLGILEMPPVALPFGTDIENNLIYVWPYLAERPLDKLTPSEQVDLYRLVPPAKVSEMREKKRWLWWRLVIAADGTWTLFKKAN